MFPISEEEIKEIVIHLNELNICNRCIVRYLGNSFSDGWDTFITPENLLHGFSFWDDTFNTTAVKVHPCRACLDLLNDVTLQQFLTVIPDCHKSYGMVDFGLLVHLPISLYLREHAMHIYLKDKFPSVYKSSTGIIEIKRVLKIVFGTYACARLNKVYRDISNLQIILNIGYPDEEKEIKNISNLFTKISRSSILGYLNSCPDEKFKQQISVPPTIQTVSLTAEISFGSSTIYLGGRYLKFSREMGQTPFIVNNVAITELSVQAVIFDAIIQVLGCDRKSLTFCASGREDADTRMVGTGRPFYIQLTNPNLDIIKPAQCRMIENLIVESNAVVVIKLQQVSTSEVKKIKFGEEEKMKNYQALCKIITPNIDEAVRLINSYHDIINLDQATPIRVLHRRTHLTRKKIIYEMKASVVPGHSDLILLDLIAAAGTYIKEFVNGDFNRTKPNLCEITNCPIDVVALDVVKIDLEWP